MTQSYVAACAGAFLALGAAAQAAPLFPPQFDPAHQRLASTVEALLPVTIDHQRCDTEHYAGWMDRHGVVVCSEHSRDFADFQDTLRHEAVHVAQRCKAYLSGLPGLVPISDSFVAAGFDRFPGVLSQYPDKDQNIEAEAWWLAATATSQQVDQLVRLQCPFAF